MTEVSVVNNMILCKNMIWSHCRKSQHILMSTNGCLSGRLAGQVTFYPKPNWMAGVFHIYVYICMQSCPSGCLPPSPATTPAPLWSHPCLPTRTAWRSPKYGTVGKKHTYPKFIGGCKLLIWEQFFLYLLCGRKIKKVADCFGLKK